MTDYDVLRRNYHTAFGGRVGFGRNPALLVVDFMNAYVKEGSPFFAAGVVGAVAETVSLLAAARQRRIPVIHTRVVVRPDGRDAGVWPRKLAALTELVEGSPLSKIVPELAPRPEELVLTKQYASAFFGTPLGTTLTKNGIDTLLLAGCSTSGCIRATAVDGLQYGFRVIVPRECVGDRRDEPHEANLFDIDSKYGDVVSKQEVLNYLADLKTVAA